MASILGIWETDLERALLRRGVDRRQDDEQRCADCRRVPLIGETMHDYGRDQVCTLCAEHRGPAEGHRLVHHSEHGISVRRLKPKVAA